MKKVKVRAYTSPTLVLLAFDWPDGGSRQDFLGFAIRRSPGYAQEGESWLPNRVGFNGPAPDGGDLPSNTSPIQKFLWWDARIDDEDRGKTFTYRVAPVVGTPDSPNLVTECETSLPVAVPHPVNSVLGVGTYFNRAVVSSQAFVKEFGRDIDEEKMHKALAWLANGLQNAIPGFLKDSTAVEGAIYHLTDSEWVLPALEEYQGRASLVYNETSKDDSNADAVQQLGGKMEFFPRTKMKIMHNKFLVRVEGSGEESKAVALLTGSANFTTEGLSTQANVLHTFESPGLAKLYRARKVLLQDDPKKAATIAGAIGWSDPVRLKDGKTSVRVFFSPESGRESIDTIVEAVDRATSSVLFCLFMPTDKPLRDAVFKAGDEGKMMFGLINKISETDPDEEPADASAVTRVEIYHRSKENKDVYAHFAFPRDNPPEGFWFEPSALPGKASKYPVYIHHKFVIIDAETDHPVVYTGSANMSKSSLGFNDENLLEITGSRDLAAAYLAEFLRLYEHYRARAIWSRSRHEDWKTFRLLPDASWARKAYTKGTPEFKSRINMVSG
jgi:phosphatidylserine/phosphatidylglycerophosphate/cardiolipin synthase-like enzyme